MSDRRFLVLLVLAVFLCAPAFAEESLFRDLSRESLPSRGGSWEIPLPRHFRALEVDVKALENLLARAPAERSEAAAAEPLLLALPYPDGTDRLFRVEESPILEPELAARFPEIRTFVAQGIDDPTATARLSLTSLGFHAMVLSAAGTVFVDPYRRWDARYVLSYFKAEARKPAGADFHCDVKEEGQKEEEDFAREVPPVPLAVASGTQLRTYRLALAATGEYSAAVCAPNPAAVSCALNAMVVSMNRVDGVYEREVAIRMVLVANDNLIVYTNGATDPYTNGNGSTMLGQNQTNLNSVIGSANYDIGHVFSTGGGGVAELGVPVHEQQGARRHRQLQSDRRRLRHRLRGPRDGAPVRRQPHLQRHHQQLRQRQPQRVVRPTSRAAAPRSWPTPASAAPRTSSRTATTPSTPGASMRSWRSRPAHGQLLRRRSPPPAITPPSVNAGAAFTIPKQTPFTLTGSATDPDGDPLTYMWEEFDLGTAAPPNDDVDAVRPIFRSFVPLTVPSRTFPRLSDILANVATIGESMSTRNRTMTFRLTARDNRTGGGGVNYASTTVTVNAAAGPFVVTRPTPR